ncbi:MAG: hypothetical protein ACI9WU_004313 [Myxococcota bacterium]
MIDPTFVRAVLADALGDLLEEFVSSLPLAGAAGSLLGSITRKAGRFSGSSVPFAGQAQQFAADAAERLRVRLIEAVRAPEHAQELEATLDRGAAAVLGLKTARAIGLIDDPGADVAAGWIRDVLAHNLSRPEIADGVRTQIVSGLQREAATAPTLGAWLERLSLTQTVTSGAIEVLTHRLRALAADDGFERWLAAWLQDAIDTTAPDETDTP